MNDLLPVATLSRRAMLRRSAGVAGALLVPGCVRREAMLRAVPQRPLRRFAPVLVSPDRVIRSVVGLRPFRPSGFVVRAESFGDRTVVHNYGHGGGGISLSWGSSMLAVELAASTGQSRYAVLGSGVMGLTTARLLQDRGFEATIYTKALPPDTTSNIAGGQWSPSSVSDEEYTLPEYRAQFERAARYANRYYQNLAGPIYGVRWIENYILRDEPFAAQQSPIDDLFFAGEQVPAGEHPFPARFVRRFTTMLVEPSVFLAAVTRDFLLRGGTIHVREFYDRSELLTLDERVIVNCTGLGSHKLFDDTELVPVKGQLVVLLPQPEVDYIAIKSGAYMFPRSDGIVLGGTRDRGDWSLTVDPAVTERILEDHSALFGAIGSEAGAAAR
jgi:glycine/D-amino acid oxidase-like deaminating enzyme